MALGTVSLAIIRETEPSLCLIVCLKLKIVLPYHAQPNEALADIYLECVLILTVCLRPSYIDMGFKRGHP